MRIKQYTVLRDDNVKGFAQLYPNKFSRAEECEFLRYTENVTREKALINRLLTKAIKCYLKGYIDCNKPVWDVTTMEEVLKCNL